MRQKLLTVLAFALLVAAGTVTAGAVAGKGPSSVQQLETMYRAARGEQ